MSESCSKNSKIYRISAILTKFGVGNPNAHDNGHTAETLPDRTAGLRRDKDRGQLFVYRQDGVRLQNDSLQRQIHLPEPPEEVRKVAAGIHAAQLLRGTEGALQGAGHRGAGKGLDGASGAALRHECRQAYGQGAAGIDAGRPTLRIRKKESTA